LKNPECLDSQSPQGNMKKSRK